MSWLVCWLIASLAFVDVHNGAVTATATIFIAVFTIVLAIVTRRQALLTREAIILARDEFNATYRPKLRVRRMKPKFTDGTPVRVQYIIVNVGETIAIINRHEITLYIQSAASGSKPIQQKIRLECRQLKGGESSLFLTNIDDQYNYGWGMADDESCILKIRGIVEYEDGVGTTRRTGFLRTYDVKLGRFRASDDTEEEYED